MTFTQLTRVAGFLVLLASAACIPHGVVNLTDTLRVAGGTEIQPHSWPFLVRVSLIKNGWETTCGGSILDEFYILTAGHCIKGYEENASARVTAGEHDLTVDEGSEQVRDVEQFILHPEYSWNNDLALLKLKSPLNLTTSKVKAIALNPGDSFPPPGTVCFVAGWGGAKNGEAAPSSPVSAQVTVHTNAECRKLGGHIPDSTLCAWEENHDKGPCSGDSGGPFVCTCPCCDVPVQMGVASWIYLPCGQPSAYVRTSYFHKWITDTMASHGRRSGGGDQPVASAAP